VAVNSLLPLTPSGRYRPQEPSIASSPEDTRLAMCQFEFGMRNRINAVERLAGASKPFVFAQATDESRSVGVTPIRHFELPRKLPRKCPAAPDPRRSLAATVCRQFESDIHIFSGIWLNCRPSPIVTDPPRTSRMSGPARTRTEDQGIHFCPAVSGGSGLSLHPSGVRDALACH